MVVLGEGPLEPVEGGVRFAAERVNLGNLDCRGFGVVVDECPQRGIRLCTLPKAEECERDAGLAFPVDLLLLEFRQRLGVASLKEADAPEDRVLLRTVRHQPQRRCERRFGFVQGA